MNKTGEYLEWRANTLRITCFPNPGYSGDQKWWEKITGTTPEIIQQQPKTSGISIKGDYEHTKLSLDIQPFRFDWRIFPPESSDFESVANLGRVQVAFNMVYQIIDKWLPYASDLDLNRIAFAGTLQQSVKSKDHGYSQLAMYLKDIHIDWNNTSDFLLQINNPRKINLVNDSLVINRLSRWSVGALKITILQPHLYNFENQPPERFLINLDFDINTSADYIGKFSIKEFREIFPTLMTFAEEIACKGCVP